MKILLLSNSASEHTQRWAIALANHGIEVGIFSLNPSSKDWYKDFSLITIIYEPDNSINNKKLAIKLSYITNVGKLKKAIKAFQPNIVHAHYATSYGMLGMLSKFKPFIISVWGADVYDFPKKSLANKLLLKTIINSADRICSTSNCMKEVTKQFTSKEITVIPFGVETSKFEKLNVPLLDKKEITIGIIKSLEKKYGIDVLITAFSNVVNRINEKDLKLLIVGGGSKRKEYEALVDNLKIKDRVTFTGKVPHDEIITYLSAIDIFVSLSILDSESFGVSLVEAMSAGKPIVASDAEGFVEVLGDEKNGFIVPKFSSEKAADAIVEYIEHPEIAIIKGNSARSRAKEKYEWKNNVEQMLSVYKSVSK
ncbi:MAG: glycosyltransferase [Bacteroidota bacterium]|nr:glycosyltransferase [Bacteroidota bacterium]